MALFKQREDYLKQLCENNPDVAHGANIGGNIRKSFFRLNNEDEITAEALNGISFPAVAAIQFTGRLSDTDNALVDIRHNIRIGWMFLTRVSYIMDTDNVGYTDDIQQAYDTTFAIMEDFIKTMKTDFETNGHCGAFHKFDLNQITYEPIGPVGDAMYGWRMYFEDQQTATAII